MFKPTNSHAVRNPYKPSLIPLYATTLLLIFISVLTSFVNPSFLNQFFSPTYVGLFYGGGSLLGILIFLFVSRVLHKIGNYYLMVWLLTLNFFTLLGMAFITTPVLGAVLFLVHFISLPILFYSSDVFIEAGLDNDESSTGTKRGLLLTLTGLVAAIAPLVMGIAIPESGTFSYVYVLSALFLLPIIVVLTVNFRNFQDPKYEELDVFKAVRSFWIDSNIRRVYLASLTLNIFFAITVVYLTIYIVNYIGLSWEELGIMLSVGILAYLIFEYPVGWVADNYTGEKEFMAAGFMIIALSLATVAFTTTTSVVWWTVLMFVMRIGASVVEVTTESYFFKKTKSSDAQIISFFRTTRPLSYVITVAVGSLALVYLPFNLLFVVGALLMIPAMFLAAGLEDTK